MAVDDVLAQLTSDSSSNVADVPDSDSGSLNVTSPEPEGNTLSRKDRRIDQLIAKQRGAERERDRLADAFAQSNSQNSALQAQIEELKRQFAESRSIPKPNAGAFPGWQDLGDREVVQEGVTQAQQDPAALLRASHELSARNAERIAEAKIAKFKQEFESKYAGKEEAQSKLAEAVRDIRFQYGEEVDKNDSLLNRAANAVTGHVAQKFGKEFAASPQGLQFAYAKAQQLIDAKRSRDLAAENAQLKEQLKLAASMNPSAYEEGEPPTDAMQKALDSGDVAGAVAASRFVKSFERPSRI